MLAQQLAVPALGNSALDVWSALLKVDQAHGYLVSLQDAFVHLAGRWHLWLTDHQALPWLHIPDVALLAV
jgi:hypothetical protein